MTLYANFITNPSFEVGTTGWETSRSGVTLSRVTTSPTAGSYVLRASYSSSGSSDRGGMRTTAVIEPGQPAYTLSLTVRNITENHGNQHNAGVVITVEDLLPGQSLSQRQMVTSKTVTSAGRTALRGFTPRTTADRLVITVTSSSSYYKPPQDTTESTGRVWTVGSIYPAGGGISNPAGTRISEAQWDSYEASWTRTNYGTFIFQDLVSSFNAKYATFTRPGQTIPAVNGGTVTFTIDALLLEAKAVESDYVDGDTAGYVWSGTPHASTTLGLAETQATALASSTGTILFGLILPLEAEAEASSTGTLETAVFGIEPSAFATSTGTLDVWPYGPASAAGTATSTGDIVSATIVELELLGGIGTSSGTLDSLIAVPATTSATTESTGTIEIGLPPETTASASAESTGTLEAGIAGVLEAHGFAESIGTIEILQAVPVAAFADFAIFGVTETDPRKSITTGGNGGTLTGASGSDWVRIWADVTVPDEVTHSGGTLWKRAAYVVPGIRFTGLGAGSWQEFTQVQLELTPAEGEPSPYTDGASIRTLVYPDRLNLAPGMITVVDNAGPTFTDATETTSPIDGDDAPALEFDLEPATDYTVFATLRRLKPNAAYTVSAYLHLDGMDDIGFYVRGDDGDELAATVTYADGTEAPDLTGWRRVSTTFIAPQDGQAQLTFTWTDEILSTVHVKVAGRLLEEGPELGDYFFNPGTNPEIRYRQGFTDPSGGVFHYEDSARKSYILNEALKEHVPSGIGINPPEFNLIPHYDR